MKYLHGIDRVELAEPLLRGRRTGLVTNATGVDSSLQRTADILRSRFDLVRLFAPEHGYDGIRQAGEEIGDTVDERSGLPVSSIYRKGLPVDLSGLDVLAYDIQDVGLRFFTHISVLALAMKACAAAGIPLVVFDRYDPLGLDRVGGTVLEKEHASFVGMYEIPSRYGLTPGEYARYINSEEGIGCELHVIPCAGLGRSSDPCGLGVEWIQPSPNLPSPGSVTAYCGTVVFEGTNVSEGRGTTRPFEYIGAPWIDGWRLADLMNAKGLPGAYFRPVSFMPAFSKYRGECCKGLQFHITDRRAVDPFLCGLVLLDTVRSEYPQFESTGFLTKLLGTAAFDMPGFDPYRFAGEQSAKTRRFAQKAAAFHIYGKLPDFPAGTVPKRSEVN